MLRPSCSTSAGQSVLLCDRDAAAEVAAEAIVEGAVEEASCPWLIFRVALAWDAQAPKEVQERHGFPSFPKTTPLGNFLGGSVAVPSSGAVAVAPICAGSLSEMFVAIVGRKRGVLF